MPKLVKEISVGNQFSRSSEGGATSESYTRVFRVILNSAGEAINPTAVCGIAIGDGHPQNSRVSCSSVDFKYEGDTRMVALCTFQYTTPADGGSEDNNQPPDVRPATWSISTALIEVPVTRWRPVDGDGYLEEEKAAANPIGDLYEGITKLQPVLTFVFEQFDLDPPSRWAYAAGSVNFAEVDFPGMSCDKRTLLFRGASGKPAIEFFGDQVYNGWTVSYEFAYREDTWDVRIPQSGFNIFNAPYGSRAGAEAQNVEAGSLLLKHDGGKIKNWPNQIEPAEGTGAEKTRAMVLVYEYEGGGASQLPSAMPIPLNDDGAPRWSGANPKVLIKRYSAYETSVLVFDAPRR